MEPTASTLQLTLQIDPGADAPAEERDRLTRLLKAEIQALPVESVELARGGPLPEGAKGAELVTLGSLVVVTLPVIAPKLIELLQSWSLRAENRRVKVKAQFENRSIEVEYTPSAMSAEDLKQLVNTLTQALPPAAKNEPGGA